MRYRPFGVTGKAVSSVSLLLREAPNMTTPQSWRAMVYAAMENGINCFEISAGLDVGALGVGEALRAVERRLIFLSWRLRGDGRHPMSAQAIAASVRAGLERTGAGYFDLLSMDEAAYQTLEPDAHGYLAELRASGHCLQLGIVGDGDAVDACIKSDAFDVMATPFNLTSDWKARRRVREAADRNMTIMAYDAFPPAQIRTGGGGGGGQSRAGSILRRAPEPLSGAGTYAFLHQTSSWTAEELCLAYLLTEPTFATVQVEAFRPESIARVAAVTDRDLPTGVAAQIEMARFSADRQERKRA
ncbi:MAG TPA: aldo/keto reductase [Phenylobacterium sp.]|nr:aldo/keto reductase [Phenylobacterium sp.]